MFFFEKKNQKTFASLLLRDTGHGRRTKITVGWAFKPTIASIRHSAR
jgi:hypothetical protein